MTMETRIDRAEQWHAGKVIELTTTQQDIYFDQLHHTNCSLYNIGGYIELANIDIKQMQKAHKAVVLSNDVFGIRLVDYVKGVGQVITDHRTVELPVVDMTDQCPQVWIKSLFYQPFALHNTELFKAYLLKVSDSHYYYVGLAHHIIMDGWGFSNWTEQLASFYHEQTSATTEFSWPQYVEKNRQYLHSKQCEKDRLYWLKVMEKKPEKFLSAKHSQQIQQKANIKSERVKLSLSREHHDALIHLAKEYSVSVSQIYMAAISVYFCKAYSVDHLVLGTPIHNRRNFQEKKAIGSFVSVIPVSVCYDPKISVAQFCRQIKKEMKNALVHQRYPGGLLQKYLSKQGYKGSLYEIVFNYLIFNSSPTFNGQQSYFEYVSHDHESIPIKITVWDKGLSQPVLLYLDYNLDYFCRQEVDHILARLELLLTELVLSPTLCLGQLQIIPKQEYATLMAFSQGACLRYPLERCVHEIFENQVRESPDAEAVVFNEHVITYGQLNQRANRLAQYLMEKHTVQPDELVGVFVERSSLMVIYILAILKAGAAYLPLEPRYPDERVAYMLTDSNVGVVLTEACLLSTIESKGVVGLVPVWELLDHYTTENINKNKVGLTTDNLAYVIYTSGSTGRPKGVMIAHKQLSNFIQNICEHYQVVPQDRVLQFSSISFDVFVKEFLAAFCYGATLVLRDEECILSPENFFHFCAHNCISVMSLPTAFWHQLCTFSQQMYPELKLVSAGGEEINPKALQQWFNSGISAKLIHGYGPTEVTINAASCVVSENMIDDHKIPIGRPNNNVSVYILNEDMQLTPLTMVGELYITGAGLAKGYLNRPALNKERFILNPFYDPERSNSSKLMYKTGDLGRFRVDGQLEFIGRIDSQIKIRGFRVELGEIEHHIKLNRFVDASLVLARESEAGSKTLIAYVKLHPDQAPSSAIAIIKENLNKELPEHMVPALYCVIDNWPLTNNGKIDKQALPEPTLDFVQESYVEPKNAIERTLVSVWSEILQLAENDVSVEGNFFQLGGDSILSIQLVARAAKKGLHFSIKDLFEASTIRQLSLSVKQITNSQAEQSAIIGDMPLLPIQKAFFTQGIEASHFNQSVLLDVPKGLTPKHLNDIVSKLYQRHDTLRMRFKREHAYWKGYFPVELSLQALVAETVQTQDWSKATPEQYQHCLDNVQRSLDIVNGPLFKAVLHLPPLSINDACLRLLLVIHHLVVDGVSWRILLEDISVLYHQARTRKPLHLANKSISYKKWGEHIQEFALMQGFANEQAYWLKTFAYQVPSIFSVALAKSSGSASAVKKTRFVLEKQLTTQLLTQSGRSYRTQINELLLCAVLLGVNRATGNEALCLDIEGHGREQLGEYLDVSQTVGWFTSVYPLTLIKPKGTDFAEIINSVKAQYRSVPNHGVGFGALQYICEEPEFKTLPARELVFNYLGQFDQVVSSNTLFRFNESYKGVEVSALRDRPHLLALNAMVTNRCLTFELYFPSEPMNSVFADRLMSAIESALKDLIAHCDQVPLGEYVSADFPLAIVGNREIKRWQCGRGKIDDLYPATGLQQGMLFENMLQDGRYITQLTLCVGGLDSGVFKLSWQQLIERHSILRTAFVGTDTGNVHQLVQSEAELPWEDIDLSSLPQDTRKDRLNTFLAQDKEKGFDVEKAPLIRVTLVKLNKDETQIILTHHHALLDGWSLPLIVNELMDIYRSLLQKKAVGLSAALPFREYIVWLRAQDHNKAKEYWRRQISRVNAKTPIPFMDDVVEKENVGLHSVSLIFNDIESQQVLAAAKITQSTTNVILQAAWSLLLSRYSGHSQIVYGATTSGRPAQMVGVEQIVGLFINTQPVIVEVDENLTVSSWFNQVHGEFIEREQYNYTPLYEIQSLCSLREALFDSLFVFENYPNDISIDQLCWKSGLEVHHVVDFKESHYSLTLIASLTENVTVNLEARAKRLHKTHLLQLAQHYKKTVIELVNNLAEPVGTIDMLSDEDKHVLIEKQYQENNVCSHNKLIHRLFEEQVIKTPKRAAVSVGEHQLCYIELNEHSNRLAHYLIKQGVEQGTLVGLVIERSLEMLIGILAIIKAGGAYVPLDLNYPKERIKFMLEDSGLQIVLIKKRFLCKLPLDTGVLQTVVIDSESLAQQLSGFSVNNLNTEDFGRKRLAYINYTSGSTGKPKGVLVLHRGVARLVMQPNFMTLGSSTRFLQISTISFDAATLELWGPLLNGGCCVLYPDVLIDIKQLEETINTHQVTSIFVTTGLFNQWVENMGDLSSLRWVITGGEIANHIAFEKAAKLLRKAVLINAYGPTENTTFTTCHRYTERDQDNVSIPIGKAINATQLYVLSKCQQLLPYGAEGELYIGGDGVADGYLNRASLSQERFIVNPFGAGRLYRTGDLVRLRTDGELIFVGRVDNQVKIRGFRIELDEIEQQLLNCQSVSSCAVMVRERQPGDKHLVAYVVLSAMLESDEFNIIAQLRESLSSRLPGYMLPSCFMLLPSLPLMVNGKVNREAFPEPQWRAIQEYVVPKTATEHQLVTMWSKLLHLPEAELGTDANFFELGGHSLLSVRLVSTVRDVFNYDLSIEMFLKHPRIKELGLLIDATPFQCGDDLWVSMSNLHTEGENIFCFPGVACTTNDYAHLATLLSKNRFNVKAFQHKGLLDDSSPFESIEENAKVCAEQLHVFHNAKSYTLVGHSYGGALALQTANYLHRSGCKAIRVIFLDVYFEQLNYFEGKNIHVSDNKLTQHIGMQKISQRVVDLYRHQSSLFVEYKPYLESGVAIDFVFALDSPINSRLYLEYLKSVFKQRINYVTVSGDHLSILKFPSVSTIANRIIDKTAKLEDHKPKDGDNF